MKLNANKTIMMGKEGNPKPEKRINVFRFFYYFILIFIVIYLIYYFAMKEMLVKGKGFVHFNVVSVESQTKGVIKDLNISIKVIKRGDFLCNIQERIRDNSMKINNNNTNNIINNLNLKLASLKIQYKVLSKELKANKKNISKLEALASLHLYNTNETRYTNLKNKFDDDKLKLDILKSQMLEYKKIIAKYRSKIKPETDNEIYSYVKYPVYSPVDGEIYNQSNFNDKVVKSGESLFSIITFNNVEIIAFFSQKNLNFLRPKQRLTIVLSDGTKKEGFVKSISTDTMEANFETLPKIKVIIEPLDKNITFWRRYNFLKVNLWKYKEW